MKKIGRPFDTRSIEEKLQSYVLPEPNSGCWLWSGGLTGSGYGMFWFDSKFAQEVGMVILWEKVIKRMIAKTTGNAGAGPDSNLIRHTKNTLAHHLDYIAWLVERRNWLAGDHFSVADITAAAHISVVDYFGDINWEKFESVKNWFMRIKSRPAYRGFLSDRVPSMAPAPHYAELDF